ncbi:hypothetical+protein [Methylocapsa aurea]|jgi:hypothetical protein|uniref:hypothetical protein n=1 Tax=Methylocapsa aurea TaxID=663610 RepID=UPI003D188975
MYVDFALHSFTLSVQRVLEHELETILVTLQLTTMERDLIVIHDDAQPIVTHRRAIQKVDAQDKSRIKGSILGPKYQAGPHARLVLSDRTESFDRSELAQT